MVKTARAQVVHLVLLLGALLISASAGAFLATGAHAGPLEGVVGAINQAGVEPVGEVTETVTSPIQEVTESVTQPVSEGTEALAPPVHEVTETVTPPVKEAAETLKPPVKQVTETVTSPPVAPVKKAAAPLVHLPTDSTGSSAGSMAKTAGTAVAGTVGAATHDDRETVGAATPSTRAVPSSAGGDGARGAASATPGDGAVPPGRKDDVTAVPAGDGSVRAPLPKWVAYIWPAIALTGPDLAILLDHWEQIGLHLAVGASAGSGGGFGVAGVHASHLDRSDPSGSSSLLSKIPPAISHALGSDDPTSVLAYLCLMGLVVIVVFTAVSREIAVGRRQGRGQ